MPNRDLAPGGSPFFSIDGGVTSLGTFATGEFNGDGVQAGHWSGRQGIMDGDIPFDTILQISPLDLRAMDVIGWDVAPVPEPSTFILATLGLVTLLAFASRRMSPTPAHRIRTA